MDLRHVIKGKQEAEENVNEQWNKFATGVTDEVYIHTYVLKIYIKLVKDEFETYYRVIQVGVIWFFLSHKIQKIKYTQVTT